jgi:hypothetical protein
MSKNGVSLKSNGIKIPTIKVKQEVLEVDQYL